MLLIFFLVTSSMDPDKGLSRQLPPPQQEEREVEQEIKERNVLEIRIDANNQLTCGDDTVNTTTLTERIVEFVANPQNDPELPEKSVREVNYFGRCEVSDRHVLSIQVHRQTSYDVYFQMQDAIVRAYRQLRNQLAVKKFGRPFSKCTLDEREAIGMVYPQRISEEAPLTGPADEPTGDKRKGGRP